MIRDRDPGDNKTDKDRDIVVCSRVPLLYQYWPGGFMLCLN